MRPLGRAYFMSDVLEDTARMQNVIRTCQFAMWPEESAAIAFLVCEYLKGKVNRKWRVHPINAERHRNGHMGTCTHCTRLYEGILQTYLTTFE
jgi:hypothetical protein